MYRCKFRGLVFFAPYKTVTNSWSTNSIDCPIESGIVETVRFAKSPNAVWNDVHLSVRSSGRTFLFLANAEVKSVPVKLCSPGRALRIASPIVSWILVMFTKLLWLDVPQSPQIVQLRKLLSLYNMTTRISVTLKRITLFWPISPDYSHVLGMKSYFGVGLGMQSPGDKLSVDSVTCDRKMIAYALNANKELSFIQYGNIFTSHPVFD